MKDDMYVRVGALVKHGEPTENGNVYDKESVALAVDKLKDKKIPVLLGENGGVAGIAEVSMDENGVNGLMRISENPDGETLKKLILGDSCHFSMSGRGTPGSDGEIEDYEMTSLSVNPKHEHKDQG